MMQSFLANPSFGLKLIFFVHLTLITFTAQIRWLGDEYLFYNFFFLTSILWALHNPQSEEPLYISTGINALSIFFDAILIGMYYDSYPRNGFSIFSSILNLLLRVLSTLILLRYLSEKTGRYSHFIIPGFDSPINFAGGARAPNRSSYQEIDPHGNNRPNLPTLSPSSPESEQPFP